MIMPKNLTAGDTVAITALSSPVNPAKLSEGIKMLERLGLRVVTMPSCHSSREYLAATDTQRLDDLHSAFADTKIRAVFAARGGYGAARLLPRVDYALIAQNPKIFAGFSDTTALHTVLNQFCDLITFHSPMPASDLFLADDITVESFKKNLFTKDSFSAKINKKDFFPSKKKARGILTGGNLSVITSLLGTPYEIDTAGRILFLEDTGEPPYRIDRMLLQLKDAGKLSRAEGFVLGDFSPESAETIKLAVGELLIPEGKPIVYGLPCGHCMPNITLPLGAVAEISTESSRPIEIHVLRRK